MPPRACWMPHPSPSPSPACPASSRPNSPRRPRRANPFPARRPRRLASLALVDEAGHPYAVVGAALRGRHITAPAASVPAPASPEGTARGGGARLHDDRGAGGNAHRLPARAARPHRHGAGRRCRPPAPRRAGRRVGPRRGRRARAARPDGRTAAGVGTIVARHRGRGAVAARADGRTLGRAWRADCATRCPMACARPTADGSTPPSGPTPIRWMTHGPSGPSGCGCAHD